jgi:PHD/YefM family antitoxin component YafN of YafNO toxin-antitoxin module
MTRNGRPSFVLVSPDDLESLEETFDIMRDSDLVASIARSLTSCWFTACKIGRHVYRPR